eukprot:jgi/Ulvmu1/2423/UM134_0004.1
MLPERGDSARRKLVFRRHKPAASDDQASDNAIDGVPYTSVSSRPAARPQSGICVSSTGCASVHITRQAGERSWLHSDAARVTLAESAVMPLFVPPILSEGKMPRVECTTAGRSGSPEACASSPDHTARGNPACIQRIRAWYHRLLHLRANPSSLEYSYLVLSNPRAVHYHPYDLLIVPHSQINPRFYYTMSVDGVTHFNGDESTHMTLDEFERGYFLHKQVAHLFFFSRFRIWKAFRLWRAAIVRCKAEFIRRRLSETLLRLDSRFGSLLQQVAAECDMLPSLLQLRPLPLGEALHLGEFQALVEQGSQEVHTVVTRFSGHVSNAIIKTCTACMADLDEQLYGIRDGVVADEAAVKRMKVRKARRQLQEKFPIAPEDMRPLFGAAAPLVFGRRMQPRASDPCGADAELSYALAAARRTVSRRLASLVRLCEYLMATALLERLVVGSHNALAQVTSADNGPPAAAHAGEVAAEQAGVACGLALLHAAAASVPGDSMHNQGGSDTAVAGALGAVTVTSFLVSLSFIECPSQAAAGESSIHTEQNGGGDAAPSGCGTDVRIAFDPASEDIVASVASAFEVVHAAAASSAMPPTCQEALVQFVNVDAPSTAPLSNAVVETSPLLFTLDAPVLRAAAAAAGRRVAAALHAAEEHARACQPLCAVLCRARAICGQQLERAYERGEVDVSGLRSVCQEIDTFQQTVDGIEAVVDLGAVRVSAEALVAVVLPELHRCREEVHALLPRLARARHGGFVDRVAEAATHLSARPASPDAFERHLTFLGAFDDGRRELDREMEVVETHFELCEEFGVALTAEDAALKDSMQDEYQALHDAQWAAESTREQRGEAFREPLAAAAAAVHRRVIDLRLLVQHEKLLSPGTPPADAVALSAQLAAQAADVAAEAAHVQRQQALFQYEVAPFEELQAVQGDIELKELLWRAGEEVAALTQQLESLPLSQMDVDEAAAAAQEAITICARAEVGLPPNALVPHVRAQAAALADTAALVQGLCSPQVHDRHWARLRATLPSLPSQAVPSLVVADIYSSGLLEAKDRVLEVVEEARAEARLEDALRALQGKWAAVEFTVRKHTERPEVFVIAGVDAVHSLLEDTMLSLATMCSSPYVEPIRVDMEGYAQKMQLFSDVLDEWIELQRTWIRLEGVFSTQDFKRQMPEQSQQFADVDKQFQAVVERVRDKPAALQAFASSSQLRTLRQCNTVLEGIQARLDVYLGQKRRAFPRFHFISSSELLSVLSHTRDPSATQPHMRKLFEGAARLDLAGDGRSRDVLAMVSAQHERLPLGKALKARGAPEGWLSNVETAMKSALRKAIKTSVVDLLASEDSHSRALWAAEQLGQVSILAVCLRWTSQTQAALRGLPPAPHTPAPNAPARQDSSSAIARSTSSTVAGRGGDAVTLAGLLEEYELLVGSLAAVLGSERGAGDGGPGAGGALRRQVLEALLLTVLHLRDVLRRLLAAGAAAVDDFAWQSQLRYTLPADGSGVSVQQAGMAFEYGYEYLGAQPRLVVTPLTERCFLTLTSALHLCKGCCLQGPAGTGKTETVKDLGKALGKQTIVFNCGDALDADFMALFLCGIAQCGAFACFDEFNRIDVEVLSVVAQQLGAIQKALSARAAEVSIAQHTVPLLPSCGVFVTMNPGYASRAELPDNLQALFRPVSLSVPDSAVVAEALLFCQGFGSAPELSRKAVRLFECAAQLLSRQAHYDFGMRALKTLLAAAGSARDAERAQQSMDQHGAHAPQINATEGRGGQQAGQETEAFMHALHACVIPKLVAADAELFSGIVSDVFPGQPDTHSSDSKLAAAVTAAAAAAGLRPCEPFIHKCMHLDSTLVSRFGVMLIGGGGCGKSSAISTLCSALNTLASSNLSTPQHGVHCCAINPKACSQEELYGRHNDVTGEWREGLISAAFRMAMAAGDADGGPDEAVPQGLQTSKTWVVLDGPIDSAWVENLNTVLDDSRVLCLASGERMRLSADRMNVLFEVDDLSAASPATVSRCGVVYLPDGTLTWREVVEPWLARLVACMRSGGSMHAALQADMGTIGVPTQSGTETAAGGEESGEGDAAAQLLVEYLRDLFVKHVEGGLAWLEVHADEAIVATKQQRVSTLCLWLAVLLRPGGGWSCQDGFGVAERAAVSCMFAFAFVWGLGGGLQGSSRTAWDTEVRRRFDGEANFPERSGTVFEYCCNPERNFSFQSWSDVAPRFEFSPDTLPRALYVPAPSTMPFSHLAASSLLLGRPVLVCGSAGCGKTAAMRAAMHELHVLHARDRATADAADSGTLGATLAAAISDIETAEILLGSHSSIADVRRCIDRCFGRRSGTVRRPRGGAQLVAFVDDMSMPAAEVSGAQPPLELLRTVLDRGGWHDPVTGAWEELAGSVFAGACGPSGGGRAHMSRRWTHHFAVLHMPAPSEEEIHHILEPILHGFLGTFFPPDVRDLLARGMAAATAEAHACIAEELLPTPQQEQYHFSLHTVMQCLRGLVAIRPEACGRDPATVLTRLWVHEFSRAYQHRCGSTQHAALVRDVLLRLARTRLGFRGGAEDAFGSAEQPVVFVDFVKAGVPRGERQVEMVTDASRLQRAVIAAARVACPGLVCFPTAVQHITHAAAALRGPRSHVTLLGPGGVGRHCTARAAAMAAALKAVHPPPPADIATGRASTAAFEDAFRESLASAGCHAGGICLVVAEEHLRNATCMKLLSAVLQGDMNLQNPFPPEEWDQLMPALVKACEARGMAGTADEAYGVFLEAAYDNMHVCIIASETSEEFERTVREHPSVLHRCMVNMHALWPEEALLAVAESVLEDAEEIGDKAAAARAAMAVHAAAAEAAAAPPALHLRLLRMLRQRAAEHSEQLRGALRRSRGGVAALRGAEAAVADMRAEVQRLEPELAAQRAEAAVLRERSARDSAAAAAACAAVAAEEAQVARGAAATAALRDEAQVALAMVMPALEAAETALGALNRNDIIEIKTFTKPPVLVQLTMEAVCVLLGERPDWESSKRALSDANFLKRLMEFDRDAVTPRMLGPLERICGDVSFTPEAVGRQSKAAMSLCMWVRAMHTYAHVSEAAAPLRTRLQEAQESLDAAEAQLQAKQHQLRVLQEEADAAAEQLSRIQARVDGLQQQMDTSACRLRCAASLTGALADEAGRWTAAATQHAAALDTVPSAALLDAAALTYLGPLRHAARGALVRRWRAAVCDAGLALPAAWSVQASLAGAAELRAWGLQGLPSDGQSTESATIALKCGRVPLFIDPQHQAEAWLRCKEGSRGLRIVPAAQPSALRSVAHCARMGMPCLVTGVATSIDPALASLCALADSPAARVRATFASAHKSRDGGAAVQEPPFLGLAAPQTVWIGSVDVTVAPGFALYLTTERAAAEVAPATAMLVAVVEFGVSRSALEEQLLAAVVRHEMPSMEAQHESLEQSCAIDLRTLHDHEEQTLQLLQGSSGNILDDEALIATLETSKVAAAAVKQRLEAAQAAAADIGAARVAYASVPQRAVLLFFATQAMAAVDDTYRHSLRQFKRLYERSLAAAEPSEDLEDRLQNIVTALTSLVHASVSRGLFDRHRLPLTALLAIGISASDAAAPRSHPHSLAHLLHSAPPPPSRASPSAIDAAGDGTLASGERASGEEFPWPPRVEARLLSLAQTVPAFEVLPEGLRADPDAWRRYAVHAAVRFNAELPSMATAGRAGDAAEGQPVGAVDRLALAACWQREDVQPLLKAFVAGVAGASISTPVDTTIAAVFAQSTPGAPIVLLISPGTDPAGDIMRLAKTNPGGSCGGEGGAGSGVPRRGSADAGVQVTMISLGRGQAAVAEAAIDKGAEDGHWVCLQNCHLAESSLAGLATIISDLPHRTALHPGFRLWLTLAPSPAVPPSILAAGPTLVLEPPQGLRARLMHALTAVPSSLLAPPPAVAKRAWSRVVCAVALFHAAISERRRYGPRAWSSQCVFTAGDLAATAAFLRNLVSAYGSAGHGTGAVPSETRCEDPEASIQHTAATRSMASAIETIVGGVHYGGRVSVESDHALLACMLQKYVVDAALQCSWDQWNTAGGDDTDVGRLLDGAEADHLEGLVAWAAAAPGLERVELLGLDANSAAALQKQESESCLNAVAAAVACMEESYGPLLLPPGGHAGSCCPSVPAQHAQHAEGAMDASTGLAAAQGHADAAEPPRYPEPEIEQPQGQAASVSWPVGSQALALCEHLLAALPKMLDIRNASEVYDPLGLLPCGAPDPMAAVLRAEVERYAALQTVLRDSLEQLGAALQGRAQMTRTLQATLRALSSDAVPEAWTAAAYPGARGLASWLADLTRRVAFIALWLARGMPPAVWLPGLFAPAAFLTAVLQRHSRTHRTPLEALMLRAEVLPQRTDVTAGHAQRAQRVPQEGCIVFGLSLQGAAWDDARQCLMPPCADDGLTPMPSIWLKPVSREQASQPWSAASVLEDADPDRCAILSTDDSVALRAVSASPLPCSGAQALTVQVHVDMFQTEARGRDAPAITTLELPAEQKVFVGSFRMNDAGDAAKSAWVLQNAALLCFDKAVESGRMVT